MPYQPALYTRFCRFHRQSGHSVNSALLPRRKHYHAFTMIALTSTTFNKVVTALVQFPGFKLKVVPNFLVTAWLCTIKGLAAFLFTSKETRFSVRYLSLVDIPFHCSRAHRFATRLFSAFAGCFLKPHRIFRNFARSSM